MKYDVWNVLNIRFLFICCMGWWDFSSAEIWSENFSFERLLNQLWKTLGWKNCLWKSFTNIHYWSQLSNNLNEQFTASLSKNLLLKPELWFWVTKDLREPKIKKVFHPLFLMYSYSPCAFLTFCSFYLVLDVRLHLWTRTRGSTLFLD